MKNLKSKVFDISHREVVPKPREIHISIKEFENLLINTKKLNNTRFSKSPDSNRKDSS